MQVIDYDASRIKQAFSWYNGQHDEEDAVSCCRQQAYRVCSSTHAPPVQLVDGLVTRWLGQIGLQFCLHGLDGSSSFALSCLSSESARKLTMSVSPFLLLHGGCFCDDSSQLVYSTSTLCTYVQLMTFRMMISRHNDIVVPCQISATVSSSCEVRDAIIGYDHTIWALTSSEPLLEGQAYLVKTVIILNQCLLRIFLSLAYHKLPLVIANKALCINTVNLLHFLCVLQDRNWDFVLLLDVQHSYGCNYPVVSHTVVHCHKMASVTYPKRFCYLVSCQISQMSICYEVCCCKALLVNLHI